MASKRLLRRRSCEGKRRYESVDEARAAAVLTGRKKGEKFVPYHCKFCRKWHIGHPPRAIQRRLGF